MWWPACLQDLWRNRFDVSLRSSASSNGAEDDYFSGEMRVRKYSLLFFKAQKVQVRERKGWNIARRHPRS